MGSTNCTQWVIKKNRGHEIGVNSEEMKIWAKLKGGMESRYD